jgi:pyruvate/2-oxoglutarate dehydrogenase complex dihydrolipoamide dehydrogenase (E3) component
VGYNEKRAREEGLRYSVVTSDFRETDRAMAEAETEGKIKILIDGRNRIIGTQILGSHAGELLLPSILAVRNRFKLMDLMSPIFPYPVLSEVYKKAAGGYYAPRLFNPRVRRLLRLFFGYRGPRSGDAP